MLKRFGMLESERGKILAVRQCRKAKSISNAEEMRKDTGSVSTSAEKPGRFESIRCIVMYFHNTAHTAP